MLVALFPKAAAARGGFGVDLEEDDDVRRGQTSLRSTAPLEVKARLGRREGDAAGQSKATSTAVVRGVASDAEPVAMPQTCVSSDQPPCVFLP